MAPIKILYNIYIIGRRKDSIDENFDKMDDFDRIFFLSNQKPKVFSKVSYSAGNKMVYYPALGNYIFSFKPDLSDCFERKEDALFRANVTSTRINNMCTESILTFMKAKEHIRKYRLGTLKNSIF
jgi:hypothetical protein